MCVFQACENEKFVDAFICFILFKAAMRCKSMRQFFTMLQFISFLLLLASCRNTLRKDEALRYIQQQRVQYHAAELKDFARTEKASEQFGILIDMSLPSWKKRFFVVNLRNDSVVLSGLCGHGVCDNVMSEDVKFSNVPGSNCTSEGRYKIGSKYNGAFGISYKLYGLDVTNSKAFERYVVLHAHSLVPDTEGLPACRSEGCAMISFKVLQGLMPLLDGSAKPVLLWIYK